jgi:general secretion pathway protein D
VILFAFLSSCNTASKSDGNQASKDTDQNLGIDPPMSIVGENKNKSNIIEDQIAPVKYTSEVNLTLNKLDKAINKNSKSKNYKIKENNFYDYFLDKDKHADKLQHFKINLNAVPIKEVITAFSEILDFNYYYDPNIKGLVTISINSNLTKRDLWKIFEQVLWLSGAYCSLDNDLLHVLPFSKMSRERQLLTTLKPKTNVSAILFRLANIKSSDMAEMVKPFITKGAVIIDVSSQNAVLIVDSPSNMPKLASVIKMLDLDNKQNWPKAVIKCVNIPPTYIAKELLTILPILGFPVQHVDKKGKTEEYGAINIEGIDRMQLLVVSAANWEAVEQVKKWVHVLDSTESSEQDKIFIYKIKNSKAEEMMQAMSTLFNVKGEVLKKSSAQISNFANSAGGGLSGLGSAGSSSSYFLTHNNAFTSTNTTDNNNSTSANNNNSSGGGTWGNNITGNAKKEDNKYQLSVFDVPVKVFADAVNERLMIRTTSRVYAMLKAFLQKIDTVPAQVLIQMTIADVELDAETNLGLELSDYFKGGNNKYSVSDNFGQATGGKGFEFIITNLTSGDKNAFLKALSTDSKTTTLANPEILIQSNSQAMFQVGSQIPLLTKNVTNTNSAGSGGTGGSGGSGSSGTTPNQIQTVKYHNIGIILQVTPHITAGNLISIDIDQNLSSVGSVSASFSGLAPTIKTRRLTTKLTIPDKGTIIIGGLIREDKTDTLTTIPFFGNIPIINRLLGTTDVKSTRTELLLMLTANIVRKTTPLQSMIDRYSNACELIKNSSSQQSKDNSIIFEASNKNKLIIQ